MHHIICILSKNKCLTYDAALNAQKAINVGEIVFPRLKICFRILVTRSIISRQY